MLEGQNLAEPLTNGHTIALSHLISPHFATSTLSAATEICAKRCLLVSDQSLEPRKGFMKQHAAPYSKNYP